MRYVFIALLPLLMLSACKSSKQQKIDQTNIDQVAASIAKGFIQDDYESFIQPFVASKNDMLEIYPVLAKYEIPELGGAEEFATKFSSEAESNVRTSFEKIRNEMANSGFDFKNATVEIKILESTGDVKDELGFDAYNFDILISDENRTERIHMRESILLSRGWIIGDKFKLKNE